MWAVTGLFWYIVGLFWFIVGLFIRCRCFPWQYWRPGSCLSHNRRLASCLLHNRMRHITQVNALCRPTHDMLYHLCRSFSTIEPTGIYKFLPCCMLQKRPIIYLKRPTMYQKRPTMYWMRYADPWHAVPSLQVVSTIEPTGIHKFVYTNRFIVGLFWYIVGLFRYIIGLFCNM